MAAALLLAASCDARWSSSTNPNAKTGIDPQGVDYHATHQLSYPVLGQARPGGGGDGTGIAATDDFCFTRTYSVNACVSGMGHSGNDLAPEHTWSTPQENMTVASAYNGTVLSVGCRNGSGYYIEIDSSAYAPAGAPTRFNYNHLKPNTTLVDEDQFVRAGTPIATMGWSGNCGNSHVGEHLHFDMWFGPSRSADARDPYRSIENSYATPGLRLLSDGTTPVDSAMKLVWDQQLALLLFLGAGSHGEASAQLGWPANSNSNLGRANVLDDVQGPTSTARLQYLNNGSAPLGIFSNLISGVIVHETGIGNAFIITRPYFDEWIDTGGQFGWPMETEVLLEQTQDFEFGCITYEAGSYVAKATAQCP